MAGHDDTLWELEPHTQAKHEILRRYLQAWFPILNKYHGTIRYIDGFCGPGRYTGGEPGSPLIALDAAADHHKKMTGKLVFWFIDERLDRIEHLRKELAGRTWPAHFDVHAEHGLFHEKIGPLVEAAERGTSQFGPAFVFIDPFGFKGIPFSLVARMLRQKRCEVLVTFMVDSINRFLEHPRDEVARHTVDAFGTEECVRIAEGGGDRIERLRILYQEQLGDAAKFVRFFEMRNRSNRLIYCLYFASNHSLGHVRMKEAMWRVDPQSGCVFSDATDPAQMILFDQGIPSDLAQGMINRFRNSGVINVRSVRTYVENETAFLKKHMIAELKRLEDEGKIRVEDLKTDGEKRRKGSFPDDALLTFL